MGRVIRPGLGGALAAALRIEQPTGQHLNVDKGQLGHALMVRQGCAVADLARCHRPDGVPVSILCQSRRPQVDPPGPSCLVVIARAPCLQRLACRPRPRVDLMRERAVRVVRKCVRRTTNQQMTPRHVDLPRSSAAITSRGRRRRGSAGLQAASRPILRRRCSCARRLRQCRTRRSGHSLAWINERLTHTKLSNLRLQSPRLDALVLVPRGQKGSMPASRGPRVQWRVLLVGDQGPPEGSLMCFMASHFLRGCAGASVL